MSTDPEGNSLHMGLYEKEKRKLESYSFEWLSDMQTRNEVKSWLSDWSLRSPLD